MPRVKIPAALKKSAAAWWKQHNKGREEGNAANRLKTEFRNAFKAAMDSENWPVGTYIRLGGIDYKLAASEREYVDPDPVLKLYDDEQITREQLVRMLKIDRGEAEKVIGGDQVQAFLVKETGGTADIRTSETPIENVKDEHVEVMELVRPKRKRFKFGRREEVADRPHTGTRRVIVRGRK